MPLPNNITASLNNEGYLIEFSHWDEETALAIAQLSKLELSEEHWFVINYLRHFYQAFPTIKTPSMRVLIKILREQWGAEKGNTLYFQQLFPEGLVQACKIAGLPKSGRCKNNLF